MKKATIGRILGLTVAIVAMIMSALLPIAGSSADTGVNARSDTSSTTIDGNVDDVLTANAKFKGKSKKVKSCKAYAAKLEQQAPPRDPQAMCKGKVRVKLFGKISASCPTGYFGASVMLRVKLVQKVWARAFAKSIASGVQRSTRRSMLMPGG